MKSKFAKRMVCLAAGLFVLGAAAGCGPKGEDDVNQEEKPGDEPAITWETQTEGTVLSRPEQSDAERKELLTDLNFSRGFRITLFHSNSSNGNVAGTLDYGGNAAAGGAVWTMAQWGCTHDMAAEGALTRENGVIAYDDGGKKLSFDVTKTGCVTLGIKGSEEYSKDDDGNVRERTDSTENWPHILIEQSVGHDISADAAHLYMEIVYKVTECKSLVDREIYPVD
ncbi:MAG: hypothetical protein ACI4ST_05335, partial [Candidatus Gallimonas sp.]